MIQLETETIDQLAFGAINGCEAAALLSGLHYQHAALDYDYPNFLKTMPIAADANPNHGFGGNPYTNQAGKYEAIYAQPLAQWAKQFHAVLDLTPTNEKILQQYLLADEPVVAWVTIDFAAPQYDQYPFGQALANNHAVLVSGWDTTKGYLVMDPLKGAHTWIATDKFNSAFNLRQMAVAILKN